MDLPSLSDEERARYEWQIWTSGFGEEGQRRLKAATVLISRVGGVGGTVAYYLAAAGIGRLILAHGGDVRRDDLNRQLLMTTESIGTPRVDSAQRRLRQLNPHVDVVTIAENISESNVDQLADQADVIVDAAPLFAERFLLNRAAVRRRIPMVECAMFELDARITTILPHQTPCLSCWVPEVPPQWKREFPVFGAVSGCVAAAAAMEVIKVISGIGEPLAGVLLLMNLGTMEFTRVPLLRRPDCPVCGEQATTA